MSTRQAVLEYIKNNPGKSNKDIVDATGFPRRSVYASICWLLDLGVIKQLPNLKDARKYKYYINPSFVTTPEEMKLLFPSLSI